MSPFTLEFQGRGPCYPAITRRSRSDSGIPLVMHRVRRD